MTETRLKIAVFVDFDNIEIGVKTTLGGQFDVGVVLDALKERGEVVAKTAYGDWKRAGDHSRMLTQHAIKMVQRNLTPGGDKNGADINLALDALEMCFTHDHINAFVIVGGDSDFISLVEKLKQYDKKVLVVGGRAFTSMILQRNCHEFIAYENLVAPPPARRQAERGRSGPVGPISQAPIAQAFALVGRALQVLADREVSPQIGLLKSTLLQLDSTFSERSYGATTFRDFVEKLAAAGFVNLKQTGRNLVVELRDEHQSAATMDADPEMRAPAPRAFVSREVPPEPVERAEPAAPQQEQVPANGAADPERLAEGVKEVRRLFQAAASSPRWPMYVRNVKQFLRSVDQAFDERRFGFSGIVELLRASQRDGLFRLERDRQGVLRVFPGPELGPAGRPASAEADRASGEPAEVVTAEPVEMQVDLPTEHPVVDAEPEPEAGVDVVDAEPLTATDRGGEESEEDVDGNRAEGAPSEQKPTRRRRTSSTSTARKTTTRRSTKTARPRAKKA